MTSPAPSPSELAQELRVLQSEVRTAAAESRLRDAELRTVVADLRGELAARLDSLIEAIADLRRE